MIWLAALTVDEGRRAIRPLPSTTVRDLQGKIEATEADLRATQVRWREAEARVALAEKSCGDAWGFAKTVLRTTTPSPIGSLK